MSFREKLAWISALTMGGIYGTHFFWFAQHRGDPFGGLIGTVIVLIVAQAVLTAVATIVSPLEAKAPQDERDRLIGLKATRTAYAALATGIVCCCLFATVFPRLRFGADALLFVVVAAEVLRAACQIIQYRRSA